MASPFLCPFGREHSPFVGTAAVAENCLSEDRKVYASVSPVLHEMRMTAEVIVLAMLQYEDAVLLQQWFGEDDVRYRNQFLERIRRVGEDEVETLFATSQEEEYIPAYRDTALCIQFLQAFPNKPVMVAVHLYADYLQAAPGYQFQRYTACAGE